MAIKVFIISILFGILIGCGGRMAESIPHRSDHKQPVASPTPANNSIKATSVGQTIVVTNRGAKAMSVYSVSDGNDFDLGSLAPGGQGTYVVRSAGLRNGLSSMWP